MMPTWLAWIVSGRNPNTVEEPQADKTSDWLCLKTVPGQRLWPIKSARASNVEQLKLLADRFDVGFLHSDLTSQSGELKAVEFFKR